MINPLAEQLIHDLRYDPHTRHHFDIDSWSGKATCRTVGCIAGTAILRTFASAHPYEHTIAIPELGGDWNYVDLGAELLGLPSTEVGEQLFLPVTDWLGPLQRYGHYTPFLERLTHNERPNLPTVEAMLAWANSYDDHHERIWWSPEHCAATLENLLKHERLYVDWAEGWHQRNSHLETTS